MHTRLDHEDAQCPRFPAFVIPVPDCVAISSTWWRKILILLVAQYSSQTQYPGYVVYECLVRGMER
jgi:hypothetical protein